MAYDLYPEQNYDQFLINFDTQRLDHIEQSLIYLCHTDAIPSTKSFSAQGYKCINTVASKYLR